jgi:predicted MFS family arabinose efflux permease
MAFAVGVMAANIYYPQPILALLAESLGLQPDAAGLIMALTQIGYGLGVVFVIPLGDLFENKKLILSMIFITVVAEFVLGISRAVTPYFIASVFAGLGACTVQIIIPYVSHLFDKSQRGQILGSIMSGLMLGIMLSRPVSSLLTDFVSLHAVFYVSSAVMLALWWRLKYVLPERKPESANLKYFQLIWSMKDLLVKTPTIRRRAFYQSMMFGSFCVFWTTIPLMLVTDFHFTQKGIAAFALAGLAGAIVAPFAGKAADRGHSRTASIISFAVGIISFILSHFIHEPGYLSLAILVIAANLLDAGVSAHLVLGQRAVFMIDPRNQSRSNGLYIGITYVGGAVGSAVGAWAYLHGGWQLATLIGGAMPLAALVMILTEKFFGYSEV